MHGGQSNNIKVIYSVTDELAGLFNLGDLNE